VSWISDLLGGSAGSIVTAVGGVIDNLTTTKEEKEELKIKMQALLQQRDSEIEQTLRAELSAKERVLVAELQQSDAYTKRARPTVVYTGLLFIFLNYCLVPLIQSLSGIPVKSFDLPAEFWVAWGGIVATWSIGRSVEKSGTKNKLTSVITGSKLVD